MSTNVLKSFTHAPLSVNHNDEGWGSVDNFQTQNYEPEKRIESLQDCVQYLEKWNALEDEWIIFDGSTLTFYISASHLVERCKLKVGNYIQLETLDFEAINFVVGLPVLNPKNFKLRNYTHAPLSVMHRIFYNNDFYWGSRGNFELVYNKKIVYAEKRLDILYDCVQWLEKWNAINNKKWYIFDGSDAPTFYVSDASVIDFCKEILHEYFEYYETIDAINFVIGLPTC